MKKKAMRNIYWDTTLDPIDYPKKVKEKFFKLSLSNRLSFVNWIGKISKKHTDNFDWWIKLPASRDPYKSNLYKNIIILMVLKSKQFNQNNFTLVVDSKFLQKTILNNKFLDLNITRIQIKNKNNSPIKFLKSIIFQTLVFFLVKILSKKKVFADSYEITLIDTFLGCNEKLKDFVYPDLDKIIKKNRVNNVFFVPNILVSRDIFNLIKNLLVISKKNYIFKEQYLNFKEFCLCLYQSLNGFSKINQKNYEKYGGVDCSLIIKEELYSRKEFYSEFESKLKLLFIKNLKSSNLNIKKAIGRFENQSIDKAWNYGFRKYFPKTEVLGYQGFLYYPHLTNETPAAYEEKAKLIPKKIILTGKVLKKPRSEFFKNVKIIFGPSLGKQDIFNEIKKKYEYKFVLALCGIKSLDEKLILWSKYAIERNKKLKLVIKPHPILPINKISSFSHSDIEKGQVIISHENIKTLLQKTEILISSGPTSIIFESMIYGCKLLYLVLDPSDLLVFKKISIPKYCFQVISSKEDLSKNMNLLAKKKFIKQNNNLRSNFYTKINKSNVKIFY